MLIRNNSIPIITIVLYTHKNKTIINRREKNKCQNEYNIQTKQVLEKVMERKTKEKLSICSFLLSSSYCHRTYIYFLGMSK